MNSKKLLLINGSPRKKGTSYSFSRTLKMLAEDLGSKAEIIHVIDYFDSREDFESLKALLRESDIIAIVAPLYADTLSYPDIWFLEKLADEFCSGLKGKDLFAIGQCGFPDSTRIEPMLNSCRLFAQETGMNWLGGLAYGGGAILNGAFFEDLGRKGEKIISGLKLAMDNILIGEKISSEAQEIITLRIPKLLYRPLAVYLNNNAKKQARLNGNVDYTRKVYLE